MLFHSASSSGDFQQLDERDRQRFSDVVEASFQVSTRQQFFVWSQSSVQGLVAHEVLLCGIRESSGAPMAMHRFSSTRYFRDEHFESLCNPLTGIVPLVLSVADSVRRTTLLCPPGAANPVYEALERQVAANELRNLAAHVVVGIGGHVEAMYGFGRIDTGFGPRTPWMVELLAPHLHRVFLRVLAAERVDRRVPPQPQVPLITLRQAQILELVKSGKTNADIAAVLGCSQWTVKNHVQAILRRLSSTSRAHAITRAISLGILEAD